MRCRHVASTKAPSHGNSAWGLLTGSVQRAAGQVRVNVSLVSATDGAVTWTEKYDRPLTNVFALQDEIARAVAIKLLGALGGVREIGKASCRERV